MYYNVIIEYSEVRKIMAKKKAGSKNLMNYIFFGLVAVGIVLVIVGMFVGQVVFKTYNVINDSYDASVLKLFDEWGDKTFGPFKVEGVSNVFAVISFIVTLVGLAILLVDGILHCFLGKNFKIVRVVGALVTIVGAILILVAGLVMANQCYGTEEIKEGMQKVKMSFSAGTGVWLGFVGGLVGGVCGGLPLLKAFN